MSDKSTSTPVATSASAATPVPSSDQSRVAATSLYTPAPEKFPDRVYKTGLGGLASRFNPNGNGLVNIVDDYCWTQTPSRARDDVPTIQLREYEINESMLMRQVLFYAAGLERSALATAGNTFGSLDVYDEIFPKKDNKTGWKYYMPYFSDSNFDLRTGEWTTLGSISDITGGVTDAARAAVPGEKSSSGWLSNAASFATGAYNVYNAANFPVVGINDRPRLFSAHAHRTIDVRFPLFNTTSPGEWKRNRDFLYLFVNQNLFNKRDFTTGLPPVFYEVFVPGQYFSVASCVTNVQVRNIGNMREMKQSSGNIAVVPDVYDVNISLTELAMPSKNQFQAIEDGQATNRIQTGSRSSVSDRALNTGRRVVDSLRESAQAVQAATNIF